MTIMGKNIKPKQFHRLISLTSAYIFSLFGKKALRLCNSETDYLRELVYFPHPKLYQNKQLWVLEATSPPSKTKVASISHFQDPHSSCSLCLVSIAPGSAAGQCGYIQHMPPLPLLPGLPRPGNVLCCQLFWELEAYEWGTSPTGEGSGSINYMTGAVASVCHTAQHSAGAAGLGERSSSWHRSSQSWLCEEETKPGRYFSWIKGKVSIETSFLF